jgi:mRNA interferase RelE/StbE
VAHRVEISPTARRGLRRLPIGVRDRIRSAIDALAADPRPRGAIKMVGFGDRYRLRVGDYRVVYDVLDDVLLVVVIRAGHRRDIYRDGT